MLKRATLLLTALLTVFSFASAQDAPKIDSMLKDIDTWIQTDTTRIMAFIDSANDVTMNTIQKSKYWDPTVRDLSFLLGIDYISAPSVDNTGRIYYRMRITGESDALFYVDKPMGFPIQMTPNNWANEGLIISFYLVHPSGDYIIVGTNKYGDEMHDLWYFDRSGKFRPLLVDRNIRYSGVMFDQDNPDDLYLFSTDRSTFHTCRYTLSTGVLDSLYTEAGPTFPISYYKGKMLMLRYFSFSEMQLFVYDVASNTTVDITPADININNAGWTKDGKVMALSTLGCEPDEFMKVALIDPNEPEDFKVIYDPKIEIESFGIDRKNDLVLFTINRDGYSELGGMKTDGTLLKMPKTDIGIIETISSNDSGDVVFNFSSPVTAPTAYEFKLGENKLNRIVKLSTFGFDFSGIKVDVIRYKSEDGTMIPALLYVPANARMDGSNPAIIDYHGGPPGQSRPYFQRNLAFALSQGFVFMRPNVRGSTGYGPAYEKADNLEKRFSALKDAEGAIDYLIKEGYSKPEKIAIWGASYGGYTVNWLATQCPEKFAVAVSDVGVAEPDYTIVNSNPAFVASWEKEYGPVGGELNRKLAPIFYAEKITKPILLTGGFNDPRVPPADPRRFAIVLNDLGKEVYYYEDTEAGHGGSFKAQVIRDLARSYVFTMMHVMGDDAMKMPSEF